VAFFRNFAAIPLSYWLIIGGLSGALLMALWLWFKFKRVPSSAQATTAPPHWSAQLKTTGLYTLRLAIFGIMALAILSGGIAINITYQTIRALSAPAPSQVDIPADLALEIEEVTFTSSNGLILRGWFIPPKNGATIILLHGYGSNRLQMRWHAEILANAGYGVLMYDQRGSGESEGPYRSLGWEDAVDVGSALVYLNQRAEIDAEKIGIAGCSIGAQVALQGAAHYSKIGAVWADGTSMMTARDNPPPSNVASMLANLYNYIFYSVYAWHLGTDVPPGLIDIIGTITPRPIMLVGGGSPSNPFYGSEAARIRLFARHGGDNARVWIIPEARHCDGPFVRPGEYAKRMVEFFDDALTEPGNHTPDRQN
jgi:pimeloyl-ACP methyl ester carboxylesterase